MSRQTQTQQMRQQMRLSPRQLQVLRLLAVPASAMHQFLDEELQRNPLMEVTAESKETSIDEAAKQQDTVGDGHDDFEDGDEGYDLRLPDSYDPNRRYNDPVIPLRASLGEHLADQLGMHKITERQQVIGKVLIGNIDDNGYITRDIRQISDDLLFKYHIDASEDEIEQVLHLLQRLDPPGVGARNLQECLAVQLELMQENTPAHKNAQRIIGRTFNDFVAQRYDRIKERLNLDDDQLRDAINLILTLNPKPSSAFNDNADGNHYIIPDFILEREDDGLTLSLSDEHCPLLSIAPDYAEQLHNLKAQTTLSPSQKEALGYMRENAARVTELGEVIDQRNATMMKVMRSIVRRQKAYLLSGSRDDMRPLRLQDIADDTGLDISTVSRVVTRKYLRAPFGTILLKELFAKNLTADDGSQVATTAILDTMRRIVDEEDKSHPLTDGQLTAILNRKGFPLARRTVAKYRESLGIPVGRLRRRLTLLALPLMLAVYMLMQPMLANTSLQAQQPMSYYDSLIMLEQRKHGPSSSAKSEKTTPGGPAVTKEQTTNKKVQPAAKKTTTSTSRNTTSASRSFSTESGKSTNQGSSTDRAQPKSAVKSQTGVASQPSKPDTALMNADDMIDRAYAESLLPSPLWYDDNFSDCRVRLRNIPLDDMPDEINIKLINAETEFCFPVRNCITSPYGWRWNRPHRGVDIRLNTGDPVRCCFSGVVRIAKPMGAYGNLVVVRHYNGLETVYGHLSKIKVRPRQKVNAGDVLGLGGSTGRSTGPHLHFEVRFQFETFDPEWILDFSNYTLRTRWLHLDKSYFGITAPRGHRPQAFKADKSHIAETPRVRTPKPIYYDVRKGDRLDRIATLYSTTEENIYRLNPNLKKLKPGMRIRVR